MTTKIGSKSMNWNGSIQVTITGLNVHFYWIAASASGGCHLQMQASRTLPQPTPSPTPVVMPHVGNSLWPISGVWKYTSNCSFIPPGSLSVGPVGSSGTFPVTGTSAGGSGSGTGSITGSGNFGPNGTSVQSTGTMSVGVNYAGVGTVVTQGPVSLTIPNSSLPLLSQNPINWKAVGATLVWAATIVGHSTCNVNGTPPSP